MTSFDRKQKRIIVRAVYDGPGHAGKTTNLKQLVASFTTQRRGEMLSPGETNGRTVFFDWLHIDGGVIGGHALRCELLTVPGQSVLAKRRWHVLRSADVVVFVCDSTPSGIKEGRRWLELLWARMSAAPNAPPLIVQANKQDLPEALDAKEVAAALDLPEHVPIIGARAASGIGVRETVVLAIRAAANRAQKQVLASGVEHLPDATDTPDKLVGELRALEVSRAPRWMRDASPSRPPPRISSPPPPISSPPQANGPRIPRDDAPSGFIWPASTGREVLRAVASARNKQTLERMASEPETHLHRCGAFRLSTSTGRRHSGVDDARADLLLLARRKMRLGSLNVEGVALALSEDADRSLWLWTVGPWLDSLATTVHTALAHMDGRAISDVMRAYTRAVVRAAELLQREELVLDVNLEHFAMQGNEVRYVSDSFASGNDLAPLASTWLRTLTGQRWPSSALQLCCQDMAEAMAGRPPLMTAVRRAADAIEPLPDVARSILLLEKGASHE